MSHPEPRRFAGIVLATLLLLSLSVDPSMGSCVPPSIAFSRMPERAVIKVAPGDSVSLVGEYWTSDCFDTGPIGPCARGPGDERPMRGIDVDLLRGGDPVARVVEDMTAESDLTLSAVFRVPALEPGRYRILVHDRGAEGYPELFLRIRSD